jgi:hypothetical protein
VTISGTVSEIFEGGHGACVHDAFYRACGSGNPWVPGGAGVYFGVVGDPHTIDFTPAFGNIPAYSPDHTYTFTSTLYEHHLYFWAFPFGRPGTHRETYTGGFQVSLTPPEPLVTVTNVSGKKIEVQRGGGAFEALAEGDTVKVGDRVHTGWKAHVTLTFRDGSTLEIEPMSLVAIEKVEYDGIGHLHGRVLLSSGEVKAQIHKLVGAAGDFEVKSPTDTSSVRGTIFSVLYDGSITIVSVSKDSVEVKPNSGKAVVVTAGHEVSSTASKVSKPVAIGKAGAPPGSVGPQKAVALVTSSTSRGFTKCKIDAEAITLSPRAHGWSVSVKIVGARKGTAVWKILRKRVKPANKLAKTIVRGCH